MNLDQKTQEVCPFFDEKVKCKADRESGWDPGADLVRSFCRDKFKNCGTFIHSKKKAPDKES